jgi:hypothetical protein
MELIEYFCFRSVVNVSIAPCSFASFGKMRLLNASLDYTYPSPKDHRYSWPNQNARRRILFRWAGRSEPLKEKKNQLCGKYEISIYKLVLTFDDTKKKKLEKQKNAVFHNKKKGLAFFLTAYERTAAMTINV